MSKIVKTEMKGTGGGRWCRRAEAKSLSKVKRRSNDKEAIKEGEVSYEVEYTDRVTGALVSGAVSVLVKDIATEIRREVEFLLTEADLSKPWKLNKKD